jgi:hypothetical protein
MRRLIAIVALSCLLAANGNAGRGFAGSDLVSANGIGTALDIYSGPFTVSGWFYPTGTINSSIGEYDIVSHWQSTSGAQFLVSLGAGTVGTQDFYFAGACCGGESSYAYCGNLTANHWYQFVVFQNGSILKGIVTGYGGGASCNNYVGWTEGRTSGGAPFNIGGHNGSANFKGTIAEIGYWNVALSTGEMAALANGVSPAKIRRGNLVGYFPLNGASGTNPEPDLSGHKDNGTLTGTTVVPHCPCQPLF